MARRRGRDVHGWVIVDKPAGIGSTGVVGKVRWALDARKAGHAGTLDPDATGVLAVALGEATKVIPHLADSLKCYEFEVRWGVATHTDDAGGEAIATAPERPEPEAIERALAAFRGWIEQVPPQVSAVHVGGARAYDLARAGRSVTLAARPLWVEALDLIARPDRDHARFRMVCGKGGYVRSIARDLGRALDTLGHVRWLRRVWSGPFQAEGAASLPQVEAAARTPAADALLRPVEAGLAGMPSVAVDAEGAAHLRNGRATAARGDVVPDGARVWASLGGMAVALGTCRDGLVRPDRVLVRP